MMWWSLTWMLMLSICSEAVKGQTSLRDCQATETKPYIFHATKTPYELINNEDSSPIFVAGCEPIMFWMLARHGTRFPPPADVFRMKDRLPKLLKTIIENHKEERGTLCQQDVDNLSSDGNLRFDNLDEMLTATGREELLLLARRFRGRFPDFFEPIYNRTDYEFRHLDNPSSLGSARAFSRGLFVEDDVQLTKAAPTDKLIQFYDNCPRWDEQVEDNEESSLEIRLFHQSETFRNTLARVTTRLGFQYNMSADDMLLIYDTCRYQKAWNLEKISAWCAAFSVDDLKVLEYAEDLETYYKKGYGFPLNYRQACPLVEDLVTRIRGFKENGTAMSHQRGLFYFTENDALLRFVARFGLAKDADPLTHEYDPSKLAERKWRTSLMGSFGANVAVVLYNCTTGLKIQVFVKEDVIQLEQCQNSLCTFNEFISAFGPIADECAVDDGCNPNTGSIPSPSSALMFFASCLISAVTAHRFTNLL